MSFDNPSSFAQWQSSLGSASSSSERPQSGKANQSPQSGLVGSIDQSGLTPFSSTSLSSIPSNIAQRSQRTTSFEPETSLVSSPFASSTIASNRFSTRKSTPPKGSSSNNILSGFGQAGAQQSTHSSTRSVISPRHRDIPPSHLGGSGLAGNIPSGSGSGVGGGGGLGTSRSGTYWSSASAQGVPSSSAFSAERTSSVSSTAVPASSSQSSFSKISATQIVLLLDTITEKEGKTKWENKAEKIRRLLESNGKEVFVQFVRRAIILNLTAIFGRTTDFDQGSYKLLKERLELGRYDFAQTSLLAEAIDTAREESFRDFDLITFTQHFFKDKTDQSIFIVAFLTCGRSDLRTKAEDLLVENASTTLRELAEPQFDLSKVSIPGLASLLSFHGSSTNLLEGHRNEIYQGLLENLSSTYGSLPESIMSSSQLWKTPESDRALLDAFKRAGPKSTNSPSSVEDVITSVSQERIPETEIANAILFMLFSQPPQYNLQEFISVLKAKRRVDWNKVIKSLDVPNVRMTTEPFIRLFSALITVSADDSQFDIQSLWGGLWENVLTQVSYLKSFLSASTKDVKLDHIPNLRKSVVLSDFEGLPSDSIKRLQTKFDNQYASADATRAIVEVVLSSDAITEEPDGHAILQDLVQNHMDAFMLSLFRLPRPTGPTSESFIERCFFMYLEKRGQDHKLILDALYKQSPDFVNFLCTLCFHSDPIRTELIYERSEELGWMDTFLQAAATPLALDLACMRHKLRDDFDLDQYISDAVDGQSQMDRIQYGNTLWKYLRIKADDEYRVQREQIAPQSVPLSLKSVYTFLWKLSDLVSDRDQLKGAQTTCLQTYPRLMNYGSGVDEVLERRSEERGNKLPAEVDGQMSELFGRMYRGELSIRQMVSEMRELKTSQKPESQDLFCCIVHGLFDEYICYSEYPEDALEKTALLFGNIIKYSLLPPIPQEYGLNLIVDAVRDHAPESAMFRFGIEALFQINERLSEWPSICRMLLQIPALQQHQDIVQRATEGIQNERNALDGMGSHNAGEAFAMTNGTIDDLTKDANTRPFRSIHADFVSQNMFSRDPDQKAQEKILFVINNLSLDNMDAKLTDMQEVLKPEHYQWFASYLVEQRARLEPNNQQMYFEFLHRLNDGGLMDEVLRETYSSVVKMMNSRTTVDSATERSHLKNLGGWLGSLTLAQDIPIKHKNIFFIDLLLEGFDSQRLVVVIPFTCKVLVQGSRSVVFRPPNPWLMEIVGLLLELYHFAELKLNLKFEIEVLCKDLELDHKKIEPATIIRERPQQIDDDLENTSGMPEAFEGIDELGLSGPMSRGVRQRISAEEIMSSLPNLEDILRYPPLPGTANEQAMLRNIIYRAFDQAIQEIIAPVVERSITIASISTAQLVSKDYALEPDVERYRNAAREMVKSLAGSLALVTCKEPLRMSITNYIRRPPGDDAPDILSEGSIHMALNENLDIACSFVEGAAVERSIPEIDHVIEQDLEDRRRFQAENPGREYYAPNVSRWSTWIPEPYKQTPGGLNEAQRAVYEDFDRRVHGMNATHAQNASSDSTGRQIPDVLQDALAMPVLSTPADQPAIPHQSPLNMPEVRAHSAVQQSRMNGFADNVSPQDRIVMLLEEVQKAARTSSAPRIKDVEKNSSIFQDVRQILIILTSSTRPAADHIARQIAEKICHTLVSKPPQNSLEAELLAFLLHKLCMLSELIVRDVMRWTTANEEGLLASSFVTAALVSVGLMDLARIDGVIAAALREHNEHGLQLLVELMDQTLFIEEPIALRADFANSIVSLYAWLKEQPDLHLASEISSKLKAQGVPEYVTVALSDKAKAKQDQMQYIFKEWVALYENMPYNEGAYAAFLHSLHRDQIINSSEDLASFIRICIDSCVDCFESEAQSFRGSLTAAFSRTDALAQLMVLLIKYQGDSNGAVKKSKAKYFESMLSVALLVLTHHQEMRGTTFNQRVFTRLFNSTLFEYASLRLDLESEHNELIASFAKTLIALSPSIFPTFAYGWLSLSVNRVLVDGLLKSGDENMIKMFRTLLGNSYEFLGHMYGAQAFDGVFENFYRGVLRNTFAVRNDYPDFVSEHYAYLCARVPFICSQLRNLILTARPRSSRDDPDPLTQGLKIERLEESKKKPIIAADVTQPLEDEDLLSTLTAIGRRAENIDGAAHRFLEVVASKKDKDKSTFMLEPAETELFESLVAWLVVDATRGNDKFEATSAHVQLFSQIMYSADDAGRYQLATALSDNLRFPNAHTEYCSKLFLHLWGSGNSSQISSEENLMRETLLRVILERILYSRPHPWGIIYVFQELANNQHPYHFFESAGFGADSELKQRLIAAVRGH